MDVNELEKELRKGKETFRPGFKADLKDRVMGELDRRDLQPLPPERRSNLFLRVAAMLILAVGLGVFLFRETAPTSTTSGVSVEDEVVLRELEFLKQDFNGLAELGGLLETSYRAIPSE